MNIMKDNYNAPIIILLLLLVLLISLPSTSSQEDTIKPTIAIISPLEGETIPTDLPEIKVEYDDLSGIDRDSVAIIVDNYDVTEWEEATITTTSCFYTPPEFFALDDGNHTVTIQVADKEGNLASLTWMFIVDTSLPQPTEGGIELYTIITYIIIITGLAFAAFGLYIVYLRKTKKFTFKKYFAQHNIQKEVFTLYIPAIIAFLFVIFGLAYASNNPARLPDYSYEYIVVIGIFIVLAPFGIYSLLERRTIEKYERAFSQFLFEMADAMRGGLDPTKAVIELSKTHTGMLKKHLRRAADAIRIGRPFDEVITAMVRSIKSDLVHRYATLIGETSKVGGETSQVIHRTAKDMDDFIKVNQERRRQLLGQSVIIYIAIVVLLVILYQLVIIFPSLEGMDLGLIGAADLEEAVAEQQIITRMSFYTLKQRFFHLVLINALGSGTIIGMFVDGKLKYGLLHSLLLTLITVIFFIVMIL
jgi:hypothetical protein